VSIAPYFVTMVPPIIFYAENSRVDISSLYFSSSLNSIPSQGGGICCCHFARFPTGPNVSEMLRQDSITSCEVFMKTLVFFCALKQNGCLFNAEEFKPEDHNMESGSGTGNVSLYETLCDIHSLTSSSQHCNGKLIFKKDSFGKSYIE